MSVALPVVEAELGEPSVRLIAEASAQRFGVSYRELLSARRTGHLVLPRHIAMYLATKHTRRSLPEIGRLLGGRDHTTVLHARRKIEALRAEPAVAAAISEIELAIDAGTLMIERQSRPVMIDVDPFEASRKILDQDACRVSVDDVRAMASFIRASCAPLVERDAPEEIIAEMAAALPVRAPHEIIQAAGDAVASWKRLQTAEFTVGERQARAALGTAMKALSTALEDETKRRP